MMTHSLFRLLLLPVSLPGESYWTLENLTAEATLPSTPAGGMAACRPPLREGVHVRVHSMTEGTAALTSTPLARSGLVEFDAGAAVVAAG
jgi:hypothetical protein